MKMFPCQHTNEKEGVILYDGIRKDSLRKAKSWFYGQVYLLFKGASKMEMKKSKKIQKYACRGGALLLIAMMLVSFSGCRESMVIEEIIYDQASKDVDFNNKMKIAKNDENSQNKDKTLPRKKKDKTDKKTKEKHQASKKGKRNRDGEAPSAKHDANSKNDTKSDSSGTKAGDTGKKDQTSEDDSSAGASNNPNDREIYDSNGNKITLPEKVNSVVVAGAGGAATATQMLGGKNIISGSSSSFTQSSLAREVFNLDSTKTQTFWDGEGESPMSSANFEKMLKKKPDVCVYTNGSGSFSDSQIAALKKKKIACVVLPKMNTADNIQEGLNILAEMIGDRSGEDGGVDAAEMAEKYEKYCHNLISEVKGKTGLFTWDNTDFNNDYDSTGRKKTANSTAADGQYTLYLSGWENCTYKITSAGSTLFQDDDGVGIAPRGYSNSPLSYYLSVSGVCNNGARFTESGKSECAVVPFNRNVFTHSTNGSFSFYGRTTESFVRAKSGETIDSALGDNDFKGIIVDSAETKNAINSSKSWDYYGKTTVNNVTDFGFEANGKLINSYVRSRDWDIYVNPYGIDSWTEGSVESILETKWAAWEFHNAFTESEVKQEIKEFYQTFYNYSLSNSQVSQILAGK